MAIQHFKDKNKYLLELVQSTKNFLNLATRNQNCQVTKHYNRSSWFNADFLLTDTTFLIRELKTHFFAWKMKNPLYQKVEYDNKWVRHTAPSIESCVTKTRWAMVMDAIVKRKNRIPDFVLLSLNRQVYEPMQLNVPPLSLSPAGLTPGKIYRSCLH